MTHTTDPGASFKGWETSARFTLPRDVAFGNYRGTSEQRLGGLDQTIEAQIVPRLVRAHQAAACASTQGTEVGHVVSEQIATFADLVLRRDVETACASIETLRASGMSLEEIYLSILAPTARHLGHLWSEDVCDFAEATLALWRLQQILREFSSAFRSEFAHRERGLRVLLAPAPGERHELGYVMFGLVLVAEFFRREGWDAWIEPDASSGEFAEVIRNQWFDVVEFLVCGDPKPEALAGAIRNVRRESANRSVGVMTCGPSLPCDPEIVLLVGADLAAADTRQGALQARGLVEPMRNRC